MLDLSENLKPSDIIILPETVIPELYQNKNLLFTKIQKKYEGILISGVFRYESKTSKIYNSMLVLADNEFIYDKRKLVPFGEFTPFPDLLMPLSEYLRIPMSNLSKGDEYQKNILLNNFTVHPLICYESAYPNLITGEFNMKPSVIVILSNDSWFGDSLAPYQHLQISQSRALEFNRYVLRSANTGVSALIDNNGRIKSILKLNEQGVLYGSFYAIRGDTFYSRFGDYPILVLIFAIMISALILYKKNYG